MRPAALTVSLPVNMTESIRVVVCDRSGSVKALSVSELADEPVENGSPMRKASSWKGKRNYEGLWWSSTTRAHIPFESLLERTAIMAYDHEPAVVGIAAQPLALLWPRGCAGHKSHVPDLFVRYADGSGRLVDVRSEARLDSHALAQFQMTRSVCEEAGWEYEVFTEIPSPRAEGLRWISGYRQDRFAPDPADEDRILAVFDSPRQLGPGAKAARKALGWGAEDDVVALANIYHLLWAGLLSVDLDVPLGMRSEVVRS